MMKSNICFALIYLFLNTQYRDNSEYMMQDIVMRCDVQDKVDVAADFIAMDYEDVSTDLLLFLLV